jgi:hypothetical protein
MKHHRAGLKDNQAAKYVRGISNVITTIILTGIMLTILLIASFVSLSILSAQLVSTEFEQAKSNMLLLDTNVQDVSLRPGAGGYVQFNEREGGIGLTNQTADALLINATAGETTCSTSFNGLIEFIYSGGTLATAAVNSTSGYTALRGDLSYAYVNMTQGLGFLRLEQDNGAKIKLDYDRVRIISTGLIDSQTNLVQVTFIHLIKGITSGSGSVNVQVQNIQTNTTTWEFPSGTVLFTVVHNTTPQPITAAYTVTQSEATQTVVIFSEIQIQVSIM